MAAFAPILFPPARGAAAACAAPNPERRALVACLGRRLRFVRLDERLIFALLERILKLRISGVVEIHGADSARAAQMR